MKKNVTIYEIAKESGVSVSTVSRVINNNPHVSARTLRRVQDVIDKYQFAPSALARAMSINQTHSIGVITPDIANPYFSSLFLEIERHALENHYSIVLCNTLFGGSSHGVSSSITEAQYFASFAGKEVDGVIVTGGEIDKEEVSDEYLAALGRLATFTPVVIIGQEVKRCKDCLFLNRNLGGGFSSLVRHLSALGNKRIAFVGGEPGIRQTTARLDAYRSTLKSLSLPQDPALVALSNYYAKDGYSAMNRILDNPGAERPHAVVAINDAVAIGAIRAINDHGLRCPEDIAVVSGDQFFESDYITPRLTSLDQQNNYLGRLSIMTLISAINGVRETVDFEHNPRLIIRESCGSQISRVIA